MVSSFLLSDNSGRHHHLASEDQVRNLVPEDAKFAGFNLLLLTPTTTRTTSTTSTTPFDSGFASTSTIRYNDSLLVTNHGGGGPVTSRTLSSSERSCGALSNGIIDDNSSAAALWPKVQHATAHFPAVVVEKSRSTDPTDVELVEHLFKLLAWVPNNHTFFILFYISILFLPFQILSISVFPFPINFIVEALFLFFLSWS